MLITGCGKTELVYLHPDSCGWSLYHEIKRRRGIPICHQMLTHGVTVVKHRVSLKKQGVSHQSTIFLSLVSGKGGGGNGRSIDPMSGKFCCNFSFFFSFC